MKRIKLSAALMPLILSVLLFGCFAAVSRSSAFTAYAAEQEQSASGEEQSELPKDISECSAVLSENVFTYSGRPVTPSEYLTVTDGDKLLSRGVDYTLSFRNYMNPGFAYVKVCGLGDYTGSTEIGYVIAPARAEITSLSGGSGTLIVKWKKVSRALGYQIIYSLDPGFSGQRSFTVRDPGCTSAEFTNGIRIGQRWFVKVRAFITEDGSFTSERFGEYSEIHTVTVSREVTKVTIPYIAYNYTGKAVTPQVKVRDALGDLIPENCYTASYSSNKGPGIASITVTGRNGVTGSVVKEFYIRPPKNKITSLISYKKGFRLKWTAAPSGTVGYQVLYSKDPSFKKDVHSYTSTDLSDTAENFTRVPRAGEVWYVKVRSFVTRDGTTGSVRYGYYSDVKSVATSLYTAAVSRNAQLYSSAHYAPASFGMVYAGTKVEVLQIKGLWYKIFYNGHTYWVYGKAFGKSAGLTTSDLTANNVEAYADDVLFEIGCSTDKIFSFVCSHVRYSFGWDDPSRNFKAARALRSRCGPCYYSAATADLFLDRAGYEHEIMKGVQHGDVHNWNAYVKNGTTLYMETTYATYRARFYDRNKTYILNNGFRW
ncbi:hypothetical protein SAMN02910317_01360 [Ruminococcaceae bacterium FB2012]|nr:hypothetical protein SAMN02910317_01360 [Ruminococcaceae bacterium FB2012]